MLMVAGDKAVTACASVEDGEDEDDESASMRVSVGKEEDEAVAELR